MNIRKAAIIAALGAVTAALVPGVAHAAGDTTLCSSADYSCLADTGYSGQPIWESWGPGHNCVSYAAYRLSQTGPRPWGGSIGNAYEWDDKATAAGIPVNNTPAVGSIAQWDIGAGHVAYIETVTSTYIEVSEDNFGDSMPGYSSRRRLDRTGTTFQNAKFIHIRDAASQGVAVELVHYWQSGSGATDAVTVTPGAVTNGGTTTIGAVAPSNGQFGLGNFNSDGIPDLYLVITQGDPSGHAVVFVAAGPSFTTFLTAVQTPMGQFGPDHGDIVIGDFTGDSKADVGILFANYGSSNAAFGILNAATTFQSWSYLSTIPIGGHDGTRSDAVAGDFNHDQKLDLGIGFHQGTPTGKVDFFVLDGQSSYQAVNAYTLPLGGWTDGQGQLLSGRFGTASDQLAAVYTPTTASPDLFVLNGMNTVAGSWTLPVSAAPPGQRTFIGK